MGIMMSKDINNSSDLDRRISADLRARTQTARPLEHDDDEYSDEDRPTQKTGKFTWVWIVLVILAIISLICIVLI